MIRKIRNLVFEGGGVWGIAYLGVLDYLYHNGLMEHVTKVAGNSAGAITACITSFNLPFTSIKEIADTLDYKKIPQKSDIEELEWIPEELRELLDNLFGNIDCMFRLANQYGWYSTDYFYTWIKQVIASQFDLSKKQAPFTFADFKNTSIHKNKRPFLDLYIVGTNISMKTCEIFSYETTPNMEVAEAVRISMSVPLLFEATKRDNKSINGTYTSNYYCDGGVLNNYPIQLFDTLDYNTNPYQGINLDTLGIRFISTQSYSKIGNLLDYIVSLLYTSIFLQQEYYENYPINKERSISINPYNINPLDFNISLNDETYLFLYTKGYESAMNFFDKLKV